MNQTTKACGSCPFSRKSHPAELGGSPIDTYIGQSVGPFFLPCHSSPGYKGNAGELSTCKCQCAGAAIFRANIYRQPPKPLLSLPANSDPNVFSSMEEFIRHHCPGIKKHTLDYFMDNQYNFLEMEVLRAEAKQRIQYILRS